MIPVQIKDGALREEDYKNNKISDTRKKLRINYNILNDMLDSGRWFSKNIWENFLSIQQVSQELEKAVYRLFFYEEDGDVVEKLLKVFRTAGHRNPKDLLDKKEGGDPDIDKFKIILSLEDIQNIANICQEQIDKIKVVLSVKSDDPDIFEEEGASRKNEDIWELVVKIGLRDKYNYIFNELIVMSGILVYKRLGIDENDPVNYIRENETDLMDKVTGKKNIDNKERIVPVALRPIDGRCNTYGSEESHKKRIEELRDIARREKRKLITNDGIEDYS